MASKIKAAIREVEKISAAVGGRDTTPAKWMGKWEAEKSYGTLQKVEHLGSSYVCIKNCAGVDPEADVALGDGVEGVYWLLIAKKGKDGKGIERIDEVGGGEEVDGDRVVGRWKDYRITYASGKTLDYRVFGGADGAPGRPGEQGASITGISLKEVTEEGNVYNARVGMNVYPFTAPRGPQGEPGKDGKNAKGDMSAAVYDPQNRNTDIFAYVDAQVEENKAPELTGYKTGKVVRIDSAYEAPLVTTESASGETITEVSVWGKNFMRRDYTTPVNYLGVNVTWDPETQEFIFNGTTNTSGDFKLCEPFDIRWEPGKKYAFTAQQTGGKATLAAGSNGTTYAWGVFQSNAAKFTRGDTALKEFKEKYTFTATGYELDSGKHNILYMQCWRPGTVFENYRVRVQIEEGTEATEWEPSRAKSASPQNAAELMLEKGLNYVAATPLTDIKVGFRVDVGYYLSEMEMDADRVTFPDGETLQQKLGEAKAEPWVLTLEDGTQVTKKVVVV